MEKEIECIIDINVRTDDPNEEKYIVMKIKPSLGSSFELFLSPEDVNAIKKELDRAVAKKD